MKTVSYNVQYGVGKDDRYDLDRVVDAVRGADIIALQEVERNYGPPDGPSQPEDIAALLPDYYWVFGAAFDIDASFERSDGSICNLRCQHGQMLLSRWPVLNKRYYPLPRLATETEFNMQMGVLEGVLDSAIGLLRVYSVHFGSVLSRERQRQAEFLISHLRNAPAEGGAWSGDEVEYAGRDWSAGSARPPMPVDAMVMGDFNMEPDSREYEMITTAETGSGELLLTDIWTELNPGKNILTWHPNTSRPGDDACARIDHCFLTPGLAQLAISCWVDEQAPGSDHHPVWVEF